MARYHLIVALIAVGLSGGYLWAPIPFISFMLGAVLVDLDHQIDFFVLKRRFTLNVTELSKTLSSNNKFVDGEYFILPFHSYEAILCSMLLVPIIPGVFIYLSFGLILHMVFDLWINGIYSPMSFSFIYRMIRINDVI